MKRNEAYLAALGHICKEKHTGNHLLGLHSPPEPAHSPPHVHQVPAACETDYDILFFFSFFFFFLRQTHKTAVITLRARPVFATTHGRHSQTPRSFPKRWEHTLGQSVEGCTKARASRSRLDRPRTTADRVLFGCARRKATPLLPGGRAQGAKALPGPTLASVPGGPSLALKPGPRGSRARPSAYLTRETAERETAPAAVGRTALPGGNSAACLRLPRGGRRSEPAPERHFPAPSVSATSYLRLARRPVKPHFPEGCAFARALGDGRGRRMRLHEDAHAERQEDGRAGLRLLLRYRGAQGTKLHFPESDAAAKTFRVAGQLARTPSCGAVGRPRVGVLPPKVSVLRPGPLLGSSWGPWAFDARLPGTVVPKTPCVLAVMATVVSGQTTLPGHSCGRVTAVDCRRLVYRSQQWRPQPQLDNYAYLGRYKS
ncbi:uncharacterized protein LOC111090012 isoform X6 [Canis lupus familiaris]|uniref:uncharacterized protein LOC111090012 isoform X6 n=2 Tax=Canis lupus familiaris TaxID=9615 RepID=UPI0018F39657|nr:uncharacterized protein LOC111090012 isoform X6 [Canis lupus familiaris]